MRRGRARGRGLAVVVAVALHAVVLSVLAVGPRMTMPAEVPTMKVMLAPPARRPPPPETPHTPQKPIARHLTVPAPQGAPPPLPLPPAAAAPPSAEERWRLEAAPFGGEERVFRAIRLHKRCLDGERLTDWERSKCPVSKPMQPGEQTFESISADKEKAFAQEAERKAAIRSYRNTTTAPYPGLRCMLGGKC